MTGYPPVIVAGGPGFDFVEIKIPNRVFEAPDNEIQIYATPV